MTKRDIIEFPRFFDRYISYCSDSDLIENLVGYSPDNVFNDYDVYSKIGDNVYEKNKWSIKKIIRHCIDTERIMSYRALCFARGEEANLPGFDENAYNINCDVSRIALVDLLEEYSLLRKSNVLMFKNMEEADLMKVGIANSVEITPLALGFVIIGHAIHHEKIIRERYYNLIK